MSRDEKTLAWLARYEDRCAAVIRPGARARLAQAGYVTEELGRVRITEKGRQRLLTDVFRTPEHHPSDAARS